MKYIRLLEIVDRRPRISSTGSEIVTTWYCEPASAAPIVIYRLLGTVSGNTVDDIRVLPAVDYQFPYMYCVDARERPLDSRAITSAPSASWDTQEADLKFISAALDSPAVFDGPYGMKADGSFQDLPTAPDQRGRCGAYIEAIYRPLYSIYTPPSYILASDKPPTGLFDYVDPQFTSCSRVIDVSLSARVLMERNNTLGWGFAANGPGRLITDTWEEFTIRRVMCPCVPWYTITALQNRINEKDWSPQFMTIDGLLNNTFPAGTLRFDLAEVTPRTLPDATDDEGNIIASQAGASSNEEGLPCTTPMRWYDILYKFSWRTTTGLWRDLAGNQHNGPLSWNVQWWAGIEDLWAQVTNLSSVTWPPGWYEIGSSVFGTIVLRPYQTAEYSYVAYTPPYVPPNRPKLPAGANHPFDLLFWLTAP